MENSEVLNQEEPMIKDGAEQRDVEPIETAPKVLEQNTNIYASAKSVAPSIVGEKDHASTIAANTYNSASLAPREYDSSVTTTTTPSNGTDPISTKWESSTIGMENKYKVNDDEDFHWNKLAAQQAQFKYDQQEAQYRYESVLQKQEIDAAATTAFNNYFAAKYSARQTQDKMGWSGGQEKASDLQIKFLQAETAANMYSQQELQKYGLESKLAIAREYAAAEQNALALQYYQDAYNQAISEGNLTGCYVPPEASEMMIQEKAARELLNSSTSSAAEKKRARDVIANCESFYRDLGFEEWNTVDENGNVTTSFRGIKTLSTLQHEETVRNNKINEDLQRQANQIAEDQLAATKQSNYLAELQLKETIAMTNRLRGQEHIINGKMTYSSSANNYYETFDKNGNRIKNYVNTDKNLVTNQKKGANAMWFDNGVFYVQTLDGDVHRVWNDNKAHADSYAAKNKIQSNYKP